VVLGETEISADKRVFNNSAETLHLRTRSIHGALAELFERGVKHVWIEGGAKVASNFVKLGLVDEYLTYLAPMIIGGDRTAINNIDVESIADARQLVFKEVKTLGADIFIRAVEKPIRTNKGA
jgi:diaminohydroxyphosphoribosylaminopyrimidine deaminase/5-amino-6-(5-phosphoribosylamino)uracil reductase